jgi:hypothetical protein
LENWHPILAAVEGPTGTWRMLDGLGKQYGTIEIRRVMGNTDTRYRVMFRGEVIGWATSLRLACEQVHAAFLRAHGPRGGPIAGWGELPAPERPRQAQGVRRRS